MKIGIVGAGWAGLAAAWECARAGHAVLLWDMAPQAGGRGRSGVAQFPIGHPPATGPEDPDRPPLELDCGQHVLIGAYTTCLRLLRDLGVQEDAVLHRLPLLLVDGRGRGLRLPKGPSAALSFLGALGAHPDWSVGDKLRVLRALIGWRLAGFRCGPDQTVADLCRGLPARVMADWIEPLCVAALNTPAAQAGGRVFLTVLADGLFAGPGGSDLLIPRRPLHDLLPGPGVQSLLNLGASWRPRHRVAGITPHPSPGAASSWQVDGETVDRLIVATSNTEAARLIAPWDADWAACARSLPLEPIVTTWLSSPGSRLRAPMVSLCGSGSPYPEGPAQFAFDLGSIGHPGAGLFSFVSSAAGPWLERGGMAAIEAAVLQQALNSPGLEWRTPPQLVRSVAERRATLRCTPGLKRPAARAALGQGGMAVAGDYIEGPYPSTLEGAVRSGVAAAQIVLNLR